MANSLLERVERIEKLEAELTSKAAPLLSAGTNIGVVDLYIMGAANRTLAQSRGFRDMIQNKNFPCAAILLRTQIDTAMRINGIRYLTDPDAGLRTVLSGEKTFRQLVSSDKKKMTDMYLRERLQEENDWIGNIYHETSDFVHLSFRHLWTSADSVDDDTQTVTFAISGEDARQDEAAYYEACDAFFQVSKLSCPAVEDYTTHDPETVSPRAYRRRQKTSPQ